MKRNADRPNCTPAADLLPLSSHADLAQRRELLARWAAEASAVELDVVLRLTERFPSAEAEIVAFPSVRS